MAIPFGKDAVLFYSSVRIVNIMIHAHVRAATVKLLQNCVPVKRMTGSW